jgi:DNA-binding transcriptional MocR family regulator
MSEEPLTPQTPDRGVLDLSIGHPSPELLPIEMMRRAASELYGLGDRLVLQYGAERGHALVRSELAAFLTRQYGREVEQEQLLISGGVSQALDLICTVFTKPGQYVFVEDPSYFLALKIFRDHGLRIRGISTDHGGMKMGVLEKALKQDVPAFIYTIPTFQNPAGFTMGRGRRELLLRLARSYGTRVVADEVYHPLHYGEQAPPPPLGAWAAGTAAGAGSGADRSAADHTPAPVLSLGSFSKILAPGLRVGWVQGDPSQLDKLAESGLLDSGGNVNPVGAATVSRLLQDGSLETHIDTLRGIYGARMEALRALLERELPEQVSVSNPGGGYFLWLELPGYVDTEHLLDSAEARGVGFVPGTRFSGPGRQKQKLRLSISHYPQEKLLEAGTLLAELIRAELSGA